ncbi:MAG: TIGR04282 family arsenosugar biosynthesis glycosyltransferase [Thermodesulfobacteriota bacterium]
MTARLGLLLKFPIPGQVKTRLGLAIGFRPAAELYAACVADEMHAAARARVPVTVLHMDDAPADRYRCWLGADLPMLPQRGADLGERMLNACADLFAAGARCVMLAGGDIPELAPPDLVRAATAADLHGLALAPAGDGGYSLIAARNDSPLPDIFTAMPWSTPRVLPLTLERLQAAGRTHALLPLLPDLDTRDDLAALWARLRRTPYPPGRTAAWLADNAQRLGLE